MAMTAERDALARALEQLSDDQRVVITMRFYLDLEVEEIARRLGTRSGTVKSRLHRSLRLLRAAWYAAERRAVEESR
jgi:RNA polymerase sigma factor (sigma-70 family)